MDLWLFSGMKLRTKFDTIKHNTWNFESFTFLYNKQIAIPSFYFGTVLHDKSIGPNQDIHKKWHGFQTGFSYDFIIRKLIAHIFLYQEKLFKCLQTTFPHIKLTKLRYLVNTKILQV